MPSTINLHIHNNIQVSSLKIRNSAENPVPVAGNSKTLDKEALSQVVATLNQLLIGKEIPRELQHLLIPELNEVETQLALPRPKKTILKKCLQTMKAILESTASNLFIHELIAKIASLVK